MYCNARKIIAISQLQNFQSLLRPESSLNAAFETLLSTTPGLPIDPHTLAESLFLGLSSVSDVKTRDLLADFFTDKIRESQPPLGSVKVCSYPSLPWRFRPISDLSRSFNPRDTHQGLAPSSTSDGSVLFQLAASLVSPTTLDRFSPFLSYVYTTLSDAHIPSSGGSDSTFSMGYLLRPDGSHGPIIMRSGGHVEDTYANHSRVSNLPHVASVLYSTPDSVGMEMGSGSLSTLLIPDEATLFSILDQMTQSVVELHSRGLAHNDLKLDNVVFMRNAYGDYEVKLIDFDTLASTSERGSGGSIQFFPPEDAYTGETTDSWMLSLCQLSLIQGFLKGKTSSGLETDRFLRHSSGWKCYKIMGSDEIVFNFQDPFNDRICALSLDEFVSTAKENLGFSGVTGPLSDRLSMILMHLHPDVSKRAVLGRPTPRPAPVVAAPPPPPPKPSVPNPSRGSRLQGFGPPPKPPMIPKPK